MSERNKSPSKSIKIKRPKRRVRTPLKTGTIVHDTDKTYTRKEKHRKRWRDLEDGEPNSGR